MKYIAIALLAGCFFFNNAFAQKPMKFGVVFVELIVSNMPEFKTAESQIKTLQEKLQQDFKIKEEYFKSKLEEYERQKGAGTLTQAQEGTLVADLKKLQEEIQKFAADSEKRLMEKQKDFLTPLQDKVKKAIDDVAAAEGYTHVFNSQVSSTTVLITYPKEDDLTQKVMTKLGVKAAGTGGTTPGTTGGNK